MFRKPFYKIVCKNLQTCLTITFLLVNLEITFNEYFGNPSIACKLENMLHKSFRNQCVTHNTCIALVSKISSNPPCPKKITFYP